MRLAFLVLAYDRPAQFQRLLSTLTPLGTVFVHIDADSELKDFQALVPCSDQVIYSATRFSIRWAGFAMVEATLNLMRCSIEHAQFDYFLLLSGSDYPIKPDQDIRTIFSTQAQFLESHAMPHPGHSLDRLDYFFIPFKNRSSLFARILNRGLKLLPRRRWKNTVLTGMAPYSGASWWGLTHDCLTYVLEFVAQRPDYFRFFRFVKYPDEVFFHTIISNSSFGNKLQPTITYSDWWRPQPPGRPRLTPPILKHFARCPTPSRASSISPMIPTSSIS
jgi:hypothetical protein